MKYHEPLPITREEAALLLESGHGATICRVLVRLAFHEADRVYVETVCARYLTHTSADVRGAALTCLGHIARIHNALDPKLVDALHAATTDPEVGGQAEDALDDFEIFVTRRQSSTAKKP